jgi:hypothetical protein
MTWEWTAFLCGLGLALATYGVMLLQLPRDSELYREINELERMYGDGPCDLNERFF